MVEQIKWSIVICTIIKLLFLYRMKVVSMTSRCQTFKTILVVVTITSCEVGFRGWRTLVLRSRGSRFLEEGFSCIALCTDRRQSLTCVICCWQNTDYYSHWPMPYLGRYSRRILGGVPGDQTPGVTEALYDNRIISSSL